jgi:hypothetical protein
MADDQDKFVTPEEVAASGTCDLMSEGTGNTSPLDWCELFPTSMPLMTQGQQH